jgi:hypothetical protein
MAIGLGALSLAMSGAALAETWHVVLAGQQQTWTLERSASSGLYGTGVATAADGTTLKLQVMGGRDGLLIEGDLICSLDVEKLTSAAASGEGSCDGTRMVPWSATIDDPTDVTPPHLLAANEDPRQSAAYRALQHGARQQLDDEARDYIADISQTAYMNLRDPACLENQYLNIRLQREHWPGQEIWDFIQLTCMDPAKVRAHGLVLCKEVFSGDLARPGAPESDPGFCTCYADRFTDAMMAAPHAADYFEVQTSTAAANACRRQLAGTP